MGSQFKMIAAMLAGAVLGAAAVQSVQGQGKPPVYQIIEIDITNSDGYTKEYAPVVRPAIKAAGGRFLAGGKPVAIEGEAPISRVVIQQWESMEKLKAWVNSAAARDARKIGDKYAKFRVMAVEGVSQ